MNFIESHNKHDDKFNQQSSCQKDLNRYGIANNSFELIQQVHEGFAFTVFVNLSKYSGLTPSRLAEVLELSPSTLKRRRAANKFKRDESDCLYRLSQILDAAIELFNGDETNSKRWMNTPCGTLGGLAPIQMIITSAETDAVLDFIGRLEHGVFS